MFRVPRFGDLGESNCKLKVLGLNTLNPKPETPTWNHRIEAFLAQTPAPALRNEGTKSSLACASGRCLRLPRRFILAAG